MTSTGDARAGRRWFDPFFRGHALLASLRSDRFLLVATAVACAGVLLPLWVTPFVPLQDLPNHVALASLVHHIGQGGEVSSHHFVSQPYPVPYWVGYTIILAGTKLGAPLFGAKLFVALAVLAVPLGMIRLLPSLGRSPRLGLWAFALSWDYNLSWGFVAFHLGTGLSLVYLAWALDRVNTTRSGWKEALPMVGFAVLIALTHAHATVVLVAMLGALALAELPRWRSAARLTALGALPVLGLLPWLLMGIASRTNASSVPEALRGLANSPTVAKRMRNFYEQTFDLMVGAVPETMMGLCFVILLVAPLLLLAPSRAEGIQWRRTWVLYVVAWALYLVLPASLYWPFVQLYIQQRHGTLILLLGLALPACELAGAYRWRLVPGLVAVALSIGAHTWLSHRFAEHTRPFLEIIEAVPEESRILPIILEDRVRESRLSPLNQFSAYLVAEKGGYTPYLFDTPNLVVRYRRDQHLPHPMWQEPRELHPVEHAPYYDFILVQGKHEDFIPRRIQRDVRLRKLDIELVKEAGIWRLYRVGGD